MGSFFIVRATLVCQSIFVGPDPFVFDVVSTDVIFQILHNIAATTNKLE